MRKHNDIEVSVHGVTVEEGRYIAGYSLKSKEGYRVEEAQVNLEGRELYTFTDAEKEILRMYQ